MQRFWDLSRHTPQSFLVRLRPHGRVPRPPGHSASEVGRTANGSSNRFPPASVTTGHLTGPGGLGANPPAGPRLKGREELGGG